MGLFSKASPKLTNLDISSAFINDYILIEVDDDINRFNIKETRRDIFIKNMLIYKSAIIILALLSEESRDKRYSQLRSEFERLLYQNQEPNVLTEIRSAMYDLKLLLFSDSKNELSWSKNWFKQIEIEEFNPAQLTLFSIIITNNYALIINLLRKEFKPF